VRDRLDFRFIGVRALSRIDWSDSHAWAGHAYFLH
jgi:hypothetical protein